MSFAGVEDTGRSYEGRGSGPRAGFWVRLGAALVDGILLGIITELIRIGVKGGAGFAITFVIGAGYSTLLMGGPRGQTFGQYALNIRVISFESGGQLGYPRAFVRFIGAYVSLIVIFLGYFWMLWDRERQCWHDKFAGDVVVPVADYPVGDARFI